MAKKSKKVGFALIELMVVMTIIAILSGLSMTAYIQGKKSARDSKRKSDLEQVRAALEMYRADVNSYPVASLYSGDDIADGGTVYMTIPTDALAGQRYTYTSDGSTYTLCAALEVGGTIGVCDYALAEPGGTGSVASCVSCTLGGWGWRMIDPKQG